MALRPGTGWAEITGGYASRAGVYVRGEVVTHLRPGLGAFAFGQWSQHEDLTAGAGVRWSW